MKSTKIEFLGISSDILTQYEIDYSIDLKSRSPYQTGFVLKLFIAKNIFLIYLRLSENKVIKQ